MDKKLFETTDLNVINNLIDIIVSNKKFRNNYKHSPSKINSVLKFYYAFLKEQNPNPTPLEDIPKINNNSDLEVNVVDKKENIAAEKTVPVPPVDEFTSNRKSFIAWLKAKGINGTIVLNHLMVIKSFSELLEENDIIDTDLLLINDAEKLKTIRKVSSATTSFIDLSEKQKNRFLTAFDKLIEFRQDTSEYEKVSTQAKNLIN